MDNTCSIAGAATMVLGCILYFCDLQNSARHWHLFLIPAMVLMTLGAILALVGEIKSEA